MGFKHSGEVSTAIEAELEIRTKGVSTGGWEYR
jgi:hypothetical protein